MNKKRNTRSHLHLSENDLQMLEKRVSLAIKEEDISGLEKQFVRWRTVKKDVNYRMFRAAAVLICIIGLPFMVFYLVDNDEKGIFNRYYAPYSYQDITGIYRGLASEMYTPYYLYSQKEFSGALPRFRQFLEVNPADIQARLLMAVCLIEEREYVEAESELKKILQSGNIYFQDDTHWYLSLLAVRKGEFVPAREHLSQLGSNRKYDPVVQSLLKRIAGKKSE